MDKTKDFFFMSKKSLRRILVELSIAIALVESLIMLFTNNQQKTDSWQLSFYDGALLAIIVTTIFSVLSNIHHIKQQNIIQVILLNIKVFTVVFYVETVIMLTFRVMPYEISELNKNIIDTTTIAFIAPLLLYFFIQNSFENKPLASKNKLTLIALLVFVMAAFWVGLLLSNLFLDSYDRKQQEMVQHEVNQIGLLDTLYKDYMYRVALDALYIGLNSRTSLVADRPDDQSSYNQVSDTLRNIALVHQQYQQIRIIDLKGEEWVRVDHLGDGIHVSERSELQDKSERTYINETMQLNIGDIYFSSLDLNIEHGEIERPFVPVIRMATPVPNFNDDKVGTVIINLYAQSILAQLEKSMLFTHGQLELIDSSGFWLFGKPEQQLWGNSITERQHFNVREMIPGLWQALKNKETVWDWFGHGVYVAIEIKFSEFDIPKIYAEKVNANPNSTQSNYVILLSFIDRETILSELSDVKFTFLFFYLGGISVGLLAVYFYVKVKRLRQAANERISYLAHYDELTKLANRSLFYEQLELELNHARRNAKPLALFYLDLDKFKPINDRYGHDAGDFILKTVAQRLLNCTRDSDTVSRLGGDEFAIVFPEPNGEQNIKNLAERIMESITEPIPYQGKSLTLGVSIGIALSLPNEVVSEPLIKAADQLMYEVKAEGRNGYRINLRRNPTEKVKA